VQSDKVKAKILWRLYRRRYIGGKHTDVKNLRKGFPKDKYDVVNQAIDELIREGFLLVKPTHYGKHVSLNPNRLLEIRNLISELEE